VRAVGAILAAATVLLWVSDAREAAVDLPPSPWDAHLLDLEEKAIENAYLRQIDLLYGNWMKDFADQKVEQRVATGARNARNAYVRAMTQIEAKRK